MNTCKFVVIFFTVILFSGCTRTLWIQKEFASNKPVIDTVTIIFPQVEFFERSDDTEEKKEGRSIFVSKSVSDVLKEIIDEGKFITRSAVVLYDTIAISRWMQSNNSDFVARFKNTRDSLQVTQDGKRILPSNPELNTLIDQVNTKYLIYVSGIAFGTTEESKRYDLLQRETFKLFYDRPFTYDYQWYGLQLQISLVEKSSKEILWSNYNADSDLQYDPLRKEDVKGLCLKLLKRN